MNDIFALLLESNKVQGNLKGDEQRDALFGRLFGLAALSRCDMTKLQDTQHEGMSLLQAMLVEVVELKDAKSYMTAPCCSVLCDLISKVSSSDHSTGSMCT